MAADLWALLPALLGAGVIAGLLAGLLGVGGGIVIVPVLFETLLWRGADPRTAMLVATGTSLAVIVPTAVSSSLAHYRRGNIDLQILRQWLPPMIAAVMVGAWTAPRIPAEPLIFLFGAFALLVAANTLLRSGAEPIWAALPALPLQMLIAAFIGFLCVLLGIGAGTLGVAVMTACAIPTHRAVGTAATLGLAIALPGALISLSHAALPGAPPLTWGHVSLPAFAAVAPLAIICAPVGVRLGARLSSQQLQQVFAGFLLLVGLRMLSRLV